ncbi:caspase family protein [Sandarakinorhabdus sp.]|uniref:caspase family protein n=1 Tax=Sandarakinorhabdus sp. TaxID=1916663 RepID=UPI00286EA844|nr:caspase family protein [Sandarakinorhabdus sp.]
MTIRWALAGSALLLGTSAQAAVHAVFVGIDKYENSRSSVANAGFDDLSGAVGDTRRIRDALAQSQGLNVGAMPDDANCRTQSPLVETLINSCATKANINDAWTRALDAAQVGDTLLLYFAGHGSRFLDDATLDQASRYNSTLMAHDARRPGAVAGADILDHEVRRFIDAATSRGVNIVTWFDSCNSGTASRDGNSGTRTAPDLRVSGLVPIKSPLQYGNLGAYRVHLGAAGDGQDAKEVGAVGARAGVFTSALASAIIATPKASFADLAARVVADVTRATGGRQLPHAEGALRATLGGPEIKVPTFDVVLDGGKLVMAGGGLVGITMGSRFDLFASTGAALGSELGSGGGLKARVVEVSAGSAMLQPESALPPGLPGRLVAREFAHEFGGQVLRLAVAEPAALPVVQKLGFVAVDPASRFRLTPDGGGMLLSGPAGLLARLPAATAPQFGVQLASALEKVARVEHWLSRISDPGQPRDGVSLCVQNVDNLDDFDPKWCPEQPPGGPILKADKPIMVSVVNKATAPRYVTVLAIGDKYSVTQVLPGFGARDPAIDAGQAVRIPPGQEVQPDGPGRVRFVVLSSDRPLNAGVLEQNDTDVIDGQACLSPVARAFCLGTDRARAGGWSQVGQWSVGIVNAEVKP